MPRINCKCCGCPNETVDGKFVVVCEACGTEQVIPKLDSEKKTNLFNRANAARLKCDFEKALSNYEQILIDYPNDPEAHWGIVLCRYGIEYVDDPKTKKKIPTCHRTIYQSIFDDVDYKDAIKDADVVAKRIYQSEAETIDRIQKSIIAISQKEAPYDIFICYKESDENGSRTRDSFVAEDIYNELTQKNYKVFYSRITLESKLGQQYEPIIFAALQSARIMLVIGSKKEYFEAVWVKNEWSRYLSFMAENKSSKYMIPCYRDMEAYDMPDEFLSLQSQNLDRLGAKQDLIRAIDKVFGKDKVQATETKESNTILNLLKRASLCIEDEDYSKADDLLERVLDENPECAEAYTYKILIEKKLHKLDDLGNLSMPLDDDKNYQKAIRFADDDYLKVLTGYNNKILNNLNEKSKKTIYMQAVSAKSKGNYEEAVTLLNKIVDYNDSKKLIAECENLIKESLYNKAVGFKKNEKYDSAIEIFNKIIYYKDSQEQLEKCKNLKIYGEKERIYDVNTSLAIFASAHDTFDEKDFKNAIYKLKSILDYKDTEAFIKKYEEIFENNKKIIDEEALALKLAQEEEEKRKEAARIQEEQRKKEELIRRKAKRKKRTKIFLFVFASAFVVGVGIFLLMHFLFVPMGKYNHAMSLIDEGKYVEAQAALEELNYSDSANQVQMLNARSYFESNDYEKGIDIIYNIGGKVEVSYDADGGSVSIESQTISKNNTNNNAKLLAYIDNTPTMDGKRFTGWVLENYSMNYKDISATLSLKATYSLNYYRIIYKMGGGKGYYDYPSNYSVETMFSIVDPYKPGYEFLGWTGTGLSELTKNLSFKNETGDKVFTANWQAKTYTITYDVNGGNALLSNTQEVTYDSEYVLQTPTRDYYNFAGWYDSSSNHYNDGIWNIYNSVELKARWNPIIYQISYNLNGGTNSSENRNIYSYETPTITINEPTREGYTFLGWTSDDISTPTKEITIPNGSFGDKSFTANWEANDYEVTFNVNGGDSSIEPIHYTYDSNYVLPIPTREGYTFLGWEYKSQIVDVSGTWNIPNDCTLTAKWSPNTNTQYVVNHYIENIENDEYTLYKSDTLYGVSDSTIYPEVLTIYGFVSINSKKTTINPDGSTVVDYYYNRKNNTITFKSNGGTEIQSLNGKYQSKIDKTIEPLKENRTFGGWYYDEKLTSKYYTFEIDATNITLYAKWVEEVSPNELTYTKNNNSIAISGSSYVGDNFILPDYIGGVSVNAINSRAFKNSSSWKKMYIPKSVTSIGQFAFGICTSLEELSISILPENSYGLGYWFTYSSSAVEGMYATKSNYYVPTSLTRIYINGTKIPRYAFYGMTKLEQVDISNSVKTIEQEAFYNCSSIKNIVIPSSVTTIEQTAFDRCIGLEEFTTSLLPVSDYGLAYWFTKSSATVEGMYATKSNYRVPEKLTKVVINSTTIPSYSFYGMVNLKEVLLSESISNIGSYAFYNCYNIVKINSTNAYEIILPSSVKTIGQQAFYNCSLIKSIVVPSSVTSIQPLVFDKCIALEELIIPFLPDNGYGLSYWFTSSNSAVTGMYLANGSYYVPTSLTKIVVTNTETIPKNSFYGMNKLKEVEIPSTVSTIGTYAFYNCTSLVKLNSNVEGVFNLPSELSAVSSNAFLGCNNLTELNIGDKITSIGDSAFSGCINIVKINSTNAYEIILPSSVKTIGQRAFYNCSLIKSIVVPSSVTSIQSQAFDRCIALEELIIPFLPDNGYGLGYWFTSSNSAVTGMYLANGSYYVPTSLTKIVVTNTETIPKNSFYGMNKLKEVEISSTVSTIGTYAFYNCTSLVKLNSNVEGVFNLPSELSTISSNAFLGCNNLAELNIGDKTTSIGDSAFSGCKNIVRINSTTPYEAVLPNSVKTIGQQAFYGINLIKKLEITSNNINIGQSSFAGWTSLEELMISNLPANDYGLGYWFTFSTSSVSGMYATKSNYHVPISLTKIVVTNIDSIPDYSFYGMNKLIEVEIPSTISTLGAYAFYNCSLLSRLNSSVDGFVNIPSKVVLIPNSIFYGCTSVTEVSMSKDVTSIEMNAFYNCNKIVKFNSNNSFEMIIPNSCESIGTKAFYNVNLIQNIIVDYNLRTFASAPFSSMSGLVTLDIPYLPESYPLGYLFGSTSYTGGTSTNQGSTYYIPTSLTTVYLRNDPSLPSKAFINCNHLTDIYLLSYCTNASDSFTNCNATIHYDLEYNVNAPWDGTTIASCYHSGTGIETDPFVIDNPTEFAYFVNEINGGNDYSNTYFVISKDIDLNKMTIESIEYFNGSLDGNHHIIKNLTITNSSNYCGMFAHLGNKAIVKNFGLMLSTYNITCGDTFDLYYVGGFSGYNEGTISDCYIVNGSISFSMTKTVYAGGFVGYNIGNISSSYSTTKVSATSTESNSYTGGFVGYNTGSISSSFATGNATAKGLTISYSFVGGFVGYSEEESIENCYRLGTQVITRYTTSNSSSNTIGLIASIDEILSYCEENWDSSIWRFDSGLPIFL